MRWEYPLRPGCCVSYPKCQNRRLKCIDTRPCEVVVSVFAERHGLSNDKHSFSRPIPAIKSQALAPSKKHKPQVCHFLRWRAGHRPQYIVRCTPGPCRNEECQWLWVVLKVVGRHVIRRNPRRPGRPECAGPVRNNRLPRLSPRMACVEAPIRCGVAGI